jgi:hypothetical protein
MTNQTIYKSATVDYLKEHTWDYLITLNFNNIKCDITANSIVTKFYKKLNIATFGEKSRKSVKMAFSLERHKHEGYHLHILSEDPIERITNQDRKNKFNYKEIIKEQWEKADRGAARISLSCPDKKSWFKKIYDTEGIIEYITKEIKQGRSDVIQWDINNSTGYRIK